MTEMFGEAWSPMSVPDLAPDDDDDYDFKTVQVSQVVRLSNDKLSLLKGKVAIAYPLHLILSVPQL